MTGLLHSSAPDALPGTGRPSETAEFGTPALRETARSVVHGIRDVLRTWRLRRRMGRRHPEEPQIFCIGMHKTGTTSLTAALKMLGYSVIHGDARKTWPGADEGRGLLRLIEAGNYELPTFAHFDAFSDNPYFSIWRKIDEQRPGRFILTLRDENSWIESCVRYYKGRRVRPMRAWMFGDHADPSKDEASRQAWLDAYRRHNAEVQAYFAGRSDFLVLNLMDGDGWEKLCAFLGKPVPDEPFPNLNKTAR